MSNVSYARPLPRDPRPHRKVRSALRNALVWGTAATAIDLFMWLVARIFGVPFTIWPDANSDQGVELSALVILCSALLAALLAGLAVAVLGRFVRRLSRWIVIGGVVVTLASLTAPWGQPDSVLLSTKIVLTLMHLVVGGLVTYGLAKGSWADDRAVAF